ncbi:MAG: hypothetical protein NZV14_03895 [Bryobacteraceae bacterium]|nr:hypothetical protein [Bryobacteraceae bacterium]MDW8377274.1 hypothetical protein [Bryobacterales bacterium]
MRTLGLLSRLVLCLVLASAAYWSFRLAWADYLFRTNRPENIQRAAELVPFSALYQARAGNLKRAVELNPYLSSAWLELAFRAEAATNYEEAEGYLLRAAAVDQQFEPRWALANFYFRRGKSEDFWRWIRLAAERSYGDRSAIYRLCSQMSESPEEILAKGLPSDAAVRSGYLEYLLKQEQLDAAVVVFSEILQQASQVDLGVFLNLCERLLKAGRGVEGATVWNAMIERGWLPYDLLYPKGSRWITNGRLEVEPSGKGFDWRLMWRAGVHSVWLGPLHQLLIELSGKQMEQTDLLRQYVAALPAGDYLFRYRYRTEGLPKRSGVRWQIWSLAQPANQLACSEELSSAEWKAEELRFRLKRSESLVEVVLFYQRSPGTSRAAGRLRFEAAFDLQPVQPAVAVQRQ